MASNYESEGNSPWKYVGAAAAAVALGYGVFRLMKGHQARKERPAVSPAKRPTVPVSSHSTPPLRKEPNLPKVSKQHVQWIPELRVREQKILNLMPHGKQILMSDIAKQIKNVTDRTLRRDLDRLVKKGRIRRTGTTRSTTYVRV